MKEQETQAAKLVIRTLVGEPKNGMSRVIISRDALGSVIQTNRAQYDSAVTPALQFTEELDAQGKVIRAFDFDGTTLYSHYDRDANKSYFFMKTEDAKKHLLTLAQERADLPKLDLDVSEFDLNIVASAPATA